MSRIPIRVRLTLAFAVAMAVVLTVVGGLLYQRLGDSLLEQIDDNIEGFAEGVSVTLNTRGASLLEVDTAEEGLVQILGPGERVRTFPSFEERLVTPDEAARAAERLSWPVPRDLRLSQRLRPEQTLVS